MKIKIILASILFILFFNLTNAQNGIGVDLGYSSSKSYLFNFKIYKNKNAFSIGVTFQQSDTRGKKVTEQLSNYGRTVVGKGDYFYTIDLGYTRQILEKISVTGEVSVGSKNFYTNYLDDRFSDGGYHMITESESLIGFGGLLTYSLSDNFGIIAGYNTVRQFSIALQMKIIRKS